jgi:hypothetical protein
MSSQEKITTYKSLFYFASVVKGKRDVWREIFKNPEYGKYFIIDKAPSTIGMKITTSLSEIEIKKLFINYKKNVSKKAMGNHGKNRLKTKNAKSEILKSDSLDVKS